MTEQPSITCPRCGRTSYHPEDIRNGYCGACPAYTTPKGGLVTGYADRLASDMVRAMLSPGRWITDPDDAERLGLTVEARRLREQHRGPWWLAPVAVLLVAGALADLLARDWRLLVAGLVVLAVSAALALRARRAEGGRSRGI